MTIKTSSRVVGVKMSKGFAKPIRMCPPEFLKCKHKPKPKPIQASAQTKAHPQICSVTVLVAYIKIPINFH